jgi:CRP/FNR family transcriptional regulator, cyclic AMP receptor protein
MLAKTKFNTRTEEAAAVQPRVERFGDLPAALQDRIKRRATQLQFRAGAMIFRQGEPGNTMYWINSGRVRIRSLSATGKELLVVIYGQGHSIGTMSVLDGSPRWNDAVAETDVTLESLSSRDFHFLAQQEPLLYKSLATNYAAWIRDMHTLVNGLTLEERLARRLDSLLDCGVAEPDARAGGALRLDITKELLAASAAVSRQAISKLLQDWQEAGVVENCYGSILVLDRNRLRELGGKSGYMLSC